MRFVAQLFGGIIGAMQLTVMSSFDSELLGSPVFVAAGWILVFVPLGAFLGALLAAWLTRFKLSAQSWPIFLGAWMIATLSGFPLALLAPMLLVGLGPDSQKYRFLAFIIEYGLAWSALYLLCKHEQPER